MKKLIKPLALIAAGAMLACAAGCGEDTSWSFKNKYDTLSNGNWIYYTYSEYNEALNKIEASKTESSESSKDEESSVDVNKEKIEDKNAVDWIYDQAQDACVAQLTIERLISENKIKIDKEQLKNYEDAYSQYYQQYFKDIMEKLGVSEETYLKINSRYSYLQNELFTALYDEGGSKAVSDEEMKKYVNDNYVHYFYLPMTLESTDDTTTEESSGSEDAAAKKEAAEEANDKIEERANHYVQMFKSGKTEAEVVEQYKTDEAAKSSESGETTDASTIQDVSTKYTGKIDDAGLSDELKKTISGMKDKEAKAQEIDGSLYVIYKAPIADYANNIKKAEEITETDTTAVSKTTVLHNMKDEDFKSYIDSEKKKTKYDKNQPCLDKYTISRTISIIEDFNKQQSSN